MKSYKLITALFLMFLSANLFAQENKISKEEWQADMNRLTSEKASLTSEASSLKTDIAKLKSTDNSLKVPDCMNELYSLLGVTKQDVNNFNTQFSELSNKIDSRTPEKADRQAELNALKKNKISALPEYFDKVHNQLQRKLDAWNEESIVKDYSVLKGDCLWNISKKPIIYANPFAWPIIYKANRDKIKNPDLIYPKQDFRIPNLTEIEKSKYEKIRRNYKPAPPTQSQDSKSGQSEKK
jgi:nucleoid-associated protein YgaU